MMKNILKFLSLTGLLIVIMGSSLIEKNARGAASGSVKVSLYRVFELSVINNKLYSNKFTGVELTVSYTSPSGKKYEFSGFFDGDGNGGGNYQTGNIWKIRFMPNEVGKWTYKYSWSDSTPGDSGSFDCVSEGAGKGILQAYKDNPHWLAYNGTKPVWLKSYYVTGHGAIGQEFNWVIDSVYSRLVDHGYNHLQANWLLSLCCFSQYYLDGPPKDLPDSELPVYNGNLYTTMHLEIWHRMERYLGWLNDHDVGIHMFLGVDGSQNSGPSCFSLTSAEKDWFTKYMVARLAPFANLAGWNFCWEVPGNREDGELGFAQLLQKYDIFNHLRTYECQFPQDNYFSNPAYNFAAVENHGFSPKTEWGKAWTHHLACLVGYKGKPVYMTEGNALWRRFWYQHLEQKYGVTVDQNDLRQSAWACATAGASFTWCGHSQVNGLYAYGPDGLPLTSDNKFLSSENQISILARVMNKEVEFYKMNPHDDLLSNRDTLKIWALAQPGRQYLVFSIGGNPFSLLLSKGDYVNNVWLDSKTGDETPMEFINITGSSGETKTFTPPDIGTDWVLILRTDDVLGVEDSEHSYGKQIPQDFLLYQNFPNPFNPATTIQFDLPETGKYSLKIYNLLGQEVATLLNGNKSAGRYNVKFNASNLASGIYIYRLFESNFNLSRKMLLMK